MSTYSATVLQDAPSLYWRLGEPSGTNANDETANNRDGTYVNTPTLAVAGALTGDADTAITLNGTDETVSVAYSPFVTNSILTLEGWANRVSTADYDAFFSMNTGTARPWFFINQGNQDVKWSPSHVGSWYTWSAAWPGNAQWVHWALTLNDTTKVAELFINGPSKGTKTWTESYSASGSLILGAYTVWFEGSMDEFAVYEYALSAARIKHHYNVGKGRIGLPRHAPLRSAVSIPVSGAGYR